MLTPEIPDDYGYADKAAQKQRTLGSLTADDLGKTITFTWGGAIITGTLNSAQHELGLLEDMPPKTFVVVVVAFSDWRHIKTHPSDTPCEVSE